MLETASNCCVNNISGIDNNNKYIVICRRESKHVGYGAIVWSVRNNVYILFDSDDVQHNSGFAIHSAYQTHQEIEEILSFFLSQFQK